MTVGSVLAVVALAGFVAAYLLRDQIRRRQWRDYGHSRPEVDRD